MLINKIYDILEKHEVGCDIYNPEAVDEIKLAITEADTSFEYGCDNCLVDIKIGGHNRTDYIQHC